MHAALNTDGLQNLSDICSWFIHAEAASNVIQHTHGELNAEKCLDESIEENVVSQLQPLITHPVIAVRLASKLYGWIYNIGTGAINSWDAGSSSFEPLNERYRDLLDNQT